MRITPARFGRVPRAYVRTLSDRAVTPSLQDAMVAASPCGRVITMDASHSPLLSRPAKLARHLLALGAGTPERMLVGA